MWSGYINWGQDGKGNTYFALSSLLFTGPQSEAEKALWIFDMMESNYPLIRKFIDRKSNHDTWLGWHGNGTDGVGNNGFSASRLI